MTYSLVFVEGTSDSALLTGAFQRIGFSPCKKLNEIPSPIINHFPKTFPANGNLLNRVNTYPEVLMKGAQFIAIINIEGLTNLAKSLNNSLLLTGDELPSSVIIFADADNEAENDRFNTVSSVVRDHFVNFASERLEVAGINVPDKIGEIKRGRVDTGIYIWPGAGGIGTLERVVLDGISAEFPDIFALIHKIPGQVQEKYAEDHEVHKALSRGFNLDKASMAMMGGALSPSTSFSVYLSRESHKLNGFFSAPSLDRLVDFLGKFFPQDADLS